MINKNNWVPWTINTCFVIFIIALIYNESSFKASKDIEVVYRNYVDDFIKNDFEKIASHFDPPVNFKDLDKVAFNKSEVEDVYRDMKENIQEGYSYSTIDSININKIDGIYTADVIYSRFNNDDEKLYTGNTLYEFRETPEGWKMFSLKRK